MPGSMDLALYVRYLIESPYKFREVGIVIIIIFIIMHEENGTPRDEVTCPRLHSQEVAELGLKSR